MFFFDGDNYTIFKRTEIDDLKLYITIGYPMEDSNGGAYLAGALHKENYFIGYNGEDYDIIEVHKLVIYTCNDLNDLGVIGD